MSSDGERIEQHLHVLRLIMERDGLTLPEALQRFSVVVPEEDHKAVLQLWERKQRSTIIRISSPTELSEVGPRSWFAEWDTSSGYYWRRQRSFLRHVLRREEYEIDSVDRSSDRVLAHLENPQHPSRFNVRGLVVGHVQSGKTGNFSALIAKAADAGYKIVIVLSGLHNSLRQQTQKRLQRDLGHEDVEFPEGVGQGESDKWWTWLTNDSLGGDFNTSANAGFLQGHNQVILVVKKNKSRLDRLLGWLENKVPDHVPVLVIDDEADQASVNTGGNRHGGKPIAEVSDLTSADYDGDAPAEDELDPSAINLRIRKLLNSFARCSYVAYTATPFANVLINPDARDWEAGQDVFPRDFILTLPHPPGTTYVGPERLFGREQLPGENANPDGLDVIRVVPDLEVLQVAPPRTKKRSSSPQVASSLRRALWDFLLAAAGRLARSGKDHPCTMLVHVDMRKEAQDQLAEEIRGELSHIRQQWLYNRSEFLPLLRDRWEKEFRPLTSSIDLDLDAPFEGLEPYLDALLQPGIELRVLNSNHDDELDFDIESNLKAVLVGGNKLSRGVTVEGLLVSYFVRRTAYYDTLLQMGRWFGYRGDYVDLTRLYSTDELIRWFHDLATIEEELRRQVEHYARRGFSPMKAAPRIRSHEKMLPTSKNKMKEAEEQESFDGRKLQTLRFPFDDPAALDLFEHNLGETRRLLSSLGAPKHNEPGKFGWEGVSADAILRFLESFRFGDQQSLDVSAVTRYIQAQTAYNELVSWRVLVSSTRSSHGGIAAVDLGITGQPLVPMIHRSRLALDPTSLGVVTDPSDEMFGLSAEQISEAHRSYEDDTFSGLGDAFRAQRPAREGLLVLYPIDPTSQPGRNASNRRPLFADDASRPDCVVTYSISFPHSSSAAANTYLAGPKGRLR
ncbi:hypothetical protein EF919_24145 [Streptomyces sp. WAC02707]|uniref:Z1 domain-containing protein n=1 Tax=Streptomyces sp. WAC02707 TaxID=2487417 RepID=UPI000F7A70DD|nr:Z1 domain-containing protein [Streptomyces sp. WAC02707]RSS90638.1 hypothetical protein EF919_24145 [Streptomyces sp. WAC02707]